VEQELLDKNPKLKIRVYAVWFSVLRSDSPAAFPAAKQVLHDRRVKNFWDGDKEVGTWFKGNIPLDYKGPVQWDAFYLFDAGAEWNNLPEPLLAGGRPVIVQQEELSKGLAKLR